MENWTDSSASFAQIPVLRFAEGIPGERTLPLPFEGRVATKKLQKQRKPHAKKTFTPKMVAADSSATLVGKYRDIFVEILPRETTQNPKNTLSNSVAAHLISSYPNSSTVEESNTGAVAGKSGWDKVQRKATFSRKDNNQRAQNNITEIKTNSTAQQIVKETKVNEPAQETFKESICFRGVQPTVKQSKSQEIKYNKKAEQIVKKNQGLEELTEVSQKIIVPEPAAKVVTLRKNIVLSFGKSSPKTVTIPDFFEIEDIMPTIQFQKSIDSSRGSPPDINKTKIVSVESPLLKKMEGTTFERNELKKNYSKAIDSSNWRSRDEALEPLSTITDYAGQKPFNFFDFPSVSDTVGETKIEAYMDVQDKEGELIMTEFTKEKSNLTASTVEKSIKLKNAKKYTFGIPGWVNLTPNLNLNFIASKEPEIVPLQMPIGPHHVMMNGVVTALCYLPCPYHPNAPLGFNYMQMGPHQLHTPLGPNQMHPYPSHGYMQSMLPYQPTEIDHNFSQHHMQQVPSGFIGMRVASDGRYETN